MKALTPQELARCALFGAAALALPAIFHLVHLGATFMPMYPPLLGLAYFVRPYPAALTAFTVPLLSGLVTGMPPFFPPIAFLMAVELALMAALLSALSRRPGQIAILIGVLGLGRALQFGAVLLLARFMDLPAPFVAGASLLAGWPGLILLLGALPPLAALARRTLSEEPRDA